MPGAGAGAGASAHLPLPLPPAPAPAPARSPYFVISTLFYEVPNLADLPGDAPLYRRLPDSPILEPFDVAQVKHPQLLAAIEQGRVFAVWGQHFTTLQDTTNWAGTCRKARQPAPAPAPAP